MFFICNFIETAPGWRMWLLRILIQHFPYLWHSGKEISRYKDLEVYNKDNLQMLRKSMGFYRLLFLTPHHPSEVLWYASPCAPVALGYLSLYKAAVSILIKISISFKQNHRSSWSSAWLPSVRSLSRPPPLMLTDYIWPSLKVMWGFCGNCLHTGLVSL